MLKRVEERRLVHINKNRLVKSNVKLELDTSAQVLIPELVVNEGSE